MAKKIFYKILSILVICVGVTSLGVYLAVKNLRAVEGDILLTILVLVATLAYFLSSAYIAAGVMLKIDERLLNGSED